MIDNGLQWGEGHGLGRVARVVHAANSQKYLDGSPERHPPPMPENVLQQALTHATSKASSIAHDRRYTAAITRKPR